MENNNNIETIVEIRNLIHPRVFHKGDWCKLLAIDKKNNDKQITLVGNVFDLQYNIEYKLVGEYENHKTYGEQYKITILTPYSELNNANDFKKFLSYFLPISIIDNMFDTLENPIQAIKDGNIGELCKIKGVQEFTANRIIKKYNENESYAEAYVELGKYGLSQTMIKKIIIKYKNVNTAIVRLKTNPYELVTIPNIGWSKADEVAQKMGFDKMSVERLCGFIKYYMEEQAQLGNSWITTRQLFDNGITTMYKDSKINVKNNKEEILKLTQQALKRLYDEKTLYWNDDKTFIALSRYYNLEIKVSKELNRLLNAESKFNYENLNNVIRDIENERGYTLTEEQIEAIRLACESNVSIITGSSGTGKTTSVQGVLKALKDYSFTQTSLSGKAASNLKEVTGQDGATIHRLLKYNPQSGFMYNKYNPLQFDIIIVDEISLIGGEIFLSLIEAIPSGSKLIMLGDPNQLPSIGVMNLAQDMLDSPIIPKKKLTKIHRQASLSAIITESIKVKDGKQLAYTNLTETKGELQDFVIDTYYSKSDTFKKVISYFKEEYKRLQDINKIQIIVPMKERGEASVFKINNEIQNIYNSLTNGKKSLQFKRFGKDFELRVGDKVMNIKNNYRATKANGRDTQIFNGYIGIIKDINTHNKSVTINFDYDDVGDVIVSGEQLQAIDLAYCCTAHKFQGSQCDTVIVGLDYSSYKLLTRELVYTAITRSQKKCILCSQLVALQYAIDHSDVPFKQTFLKDMLEMDLELVSVNEEDIYNEDYDDYNDEEDNNNYNNSNNNNNYNSNLKDILNDVSPFSYYDDLPF